MGVCIGKAAKTNKVESQVEQPIVEADAPELVKEAIEVLDINFNKQTNDVKLLLGKGHLTRMGVFNIKATKTNKVEPQVEQPIEEADASDKEQEATAVLNIINCTITTIEENIESSKERQFTLSDMVFGAALEGNQDTGLVRLYQIYILNIYMGKLEDHFLDAMNFKEQLSGAITAWQSNRDSEQFLFKLEIRLSETLDFIKYISERLYKISRAIEKKFHLEDQVLAIYLIKKDSNYTIYKEWNRYLKVSEEYCRGNEGVLDIKGLNMFFPLGSGLNMLIEETGENSEEEDTRSLKELLDSLTPKTQASNVKCEPICESKKKSSLCLDGFSSKRNLLVVDNSNNPYLSTHKIATQELDI